MTRYRWTGDQFVNRATGEPMEAPERVCRPMVVKDVEYRSPLSGATITSRSQRREEMKAHNVREVDPSERKEITYESKKRAELSRRDWKPRAKVDLGEGYHRLTKADLPSRIAKSVE